MSAGSKRVFKRVKHPVEFLEPIRVRKGIDQADYIEKSEHFIGPAGTTLPAWLSTHDTSAAGSPTLNYVANADGGEFTLTMDTQSEQQNLALYGGDYL